MYGYSSNSYPNGTVCRVNLWGKTTTALGIMQVSIGLGFLTFSYLAYLLDLHFPYLLRFVGIGAMTGCVIICAGAIGVYTAKRRTKLLVTILLMFSILSMFCALFPLVIGILGASHEAKEYEGQSLLLPICQLVFSTVEIIVAAWAIGLCVQAFCCPNVSLGHISVQQPAGYGLSQMFVAEDGYQALSAPVHNGDMHFCRNGQIVWQQARGFQYVPIITTGGVIHGIQHSNQCNAVNSPEIGVISPNTTLSATVASPDNEAANTIVDPQMSILEPVEQQSLVSNEEDVREDICLLH